MKKLLPLLLALLILSACSRDVDTPVSQTVSSKAVEDKIESQYPAVTKEPAQSTETPTDAPVGDKDPIQELIDSITPENAEATGLCGADLIWYYKNNILIIKGTGPIQKPEGDYDLTHGNVSVPWNDYREKIHRVIISEGCTGIPERLFVGCHQLSYVDLPDSIECIGEYAFGNCPLVSFTIPKSVNELYPMNIEDCDDITSDSPNYTVENGLILSSDRTTLVECFKVFDETCVIPDGVTQISPYAFGLGGLSDIKINTLIIPSSLTSFLRLPLRINGGEVGLEGIFYGGTEEQFNSLISSSFRAEFLPQFDSTTIHYNYSY